MRPNAKCIVRKVRGADAYGQPSVEQPGLGEGCAVVRLAKVYQPSGIRAAESASRGNARDEVMQSKLLLQPDTRARPGDQVTIMGVAMRVVSFEPRLRAHGGLDHYEVTLELWA